MNKKIKQISILLMLTVTLSYLVPISAVDYGAELNPSEKTYSKIFSDVPESHWAFQFVGELVDRGAINGYPDGKFYPDKTVTREEFAKIMVVAAGLTATPAKASSYADVPLTYWASPFIETAKPYMTAYRNGTQYNFKPTNGALREDIAVAVVKLKGYDTRLADLSMINTMFSDVNAISASAQPYVALAVENGLVSGYTDGTFRGQSTITRSEAAAILWRAFQYGSDVKVTDVEEIVIPSEQPKEQLPKESEAPRPAEEPVPEDPEVPEVPEEPEEELLPYVIDTVAVVDSYHPIESMAYDADGVLYYTTEPSGSDFSGMLHTSEGGKLDLGLIHQTLAYDSKASKMYLVGIAKLFDAVVYDVTDLDSAELIMDEDTVNDPLTWDIFSDRYMNYPHQVTAQAMPNGTLLVNGYLINPKLGLCSKPDNSQLPNVPDNLPTLPSAKSVTVKGDSFYYWGDGQGVIKIGKSGVADCIIPTDEIEALDMISLAGMNIWNIAVNADGDVALYDNSNKTIRVISER